MDLNDIRAHAGEDMRRGLRVSLEDKVIGGLIAAPFAGFLGIWLNALTRWPDMVTFGITVFLWLPLSAWVAGHLARASAD